MKRGVIISILLHLALVSLLFVGFLEYFTSPESSNPEVEIIKSYAVDASTLQLDKPKTKPTPTPPITKPTPVKNKQKIEQELKAQKAQELKEKLQAQKLAQEKKIQAEISLQKKRKKKQLEKELKLKQLEIKKQAEFKKKQQEQKRKQAAELKKQQAQKRKQAKEAKKQEKLKQEQAARKAKLAEEEKLAAARRKAALEAGAAKERSLTNSIIGKYSGLIKQKMQRHWRRPADNRRLICTTKIKLLPDGSVLDVKIIRSSGSNSFDGSVIDALYNAGTFPLPPQPKYRAMFVDDDLIMKFTNDR